MYNMSHLSRTRNPRRSENCPPQSGRTKDSSLRSPCNPRSCNTAQREKQQHFPRQENVGTVSGEGAKVVGQTVDAEHDNQRSVFARIYQCKILHDVRAAMSESYFDMW